MIRIQATLAIILRSSWYIDLSLKCHDKFLIALCYLRKLRTWNLKNRSSLLSNSQYLLFKALDFLFFISTWYTRIISKSIMGKVYLQILKHLSIFRFSINILVLKSYRLDDGPFVESIIIQHHLVVTYTNETISGAILSFVSRLPLMLHRVTLSLFPTWLNPSAAFPSVPQSLNTSKILNIAQSEIPPGNFFMPGNI